MVDGSIGIWNPNLIFNNKNDESLITTLNQHEGQIRGLSFNRLKKRTFGIWWGRWKCLSLEFSFT